MSKNNNKFMTTKLKGTEMLARHSQHKPLQSSSHNDFVASGSHTSDLQEQSTVWSNSIPKLIPETKQVIYGGRGLAISKLVETMSKTPGEPMDKWIITIFQDINKCNKSLNYIKILKNIFFF
uniref:Uncharacterized protein n=1 Tax=Sipha flava TaxID=143950 RepID=A0A2S2QXU5_9HEMI